MRINLPRRARIVIYVANVLGTPFVVYALAKGWIGELEMTLWSAEVVAGFTLAGLNAPAPGPDAGPPPVTVKLDGADVARVVGKRPSK